jgi:hypothetical protein
MLNIKKYLNKNTNLLANDSLLIQKGLLVISGVPFKSDLNTWHKGVDSITFAESINNLPAKFLPRVVDFNGTDDISNKDVANFLSSATNGSVKGFIKVVTGEQNVVFASADKGSDTRYCFFDVLTSKPRILIRDATSNSITTTTTISDGWHEIEFGSTGSSYFIKVDGIPLTISVGAGADNGNWFSSVSNRDNISIGGVNRSSVIYSVGEKAWVKIDDGTNGYWITTGQAFEYDLSPLENHLTVNGSGSHYDYNINGSTYPNTQGYSLWQKVSNPDIQVPFDINGNPLSLTAGVDIPTGYTKTRDIVAGGSKWNMVDALLDMEYGSILQNVTAGIAYAPQAEAYGLVFDAILNKGSDINSMQIRILGQIPAAAGGRYPLSFLTDESIRFQRDSTTLFQTGAFYVLNNVDYRILVWRNETLNQFVTGAIGTWALYIQGKNKAITTTKYTVPNLAEMELIDVSGGSGSNPVTSNSYTTSIYLSIDNDAGDQVSKINVNGKYISPYDFTVSTGAYSIIDNPDNAVFNRTNATRQTAASRASLFYDANYPFRYQVNEIADPRIYDTLFETDYKNRVFGKVLLDGTDLIRYDEQLNYAVQRTVGESPSVLSYCKISDIYP